MQNLHICLAFFGRHITLHLMRHFRCLRRLSLFTPFQESRPNPFARLKWTKPNGRMSQARALVGCRRRGGGGSFYSQLFQIAGAADVPAPKMVRHPGQAFGTAALDLGRFGRTSPYSCFVVDQSVPILEQSASVRIAAVAVVVVAIDRFCCTNGEKRMFC